MRSFKTFLVIVAVCAGLMSSGQSFAQKRASETGYGTQNFIINGDITFNQRGNIASPAPTGYFVDRFKFEKASDTGAYGLSASSDVPTLAQSGHKSNSSLALTQTAADTTIATGEYIAVSHRIEGYNWAMIYGKPFTLSFWVKATATGTYSVGFRGGASSVSYTATYTINATETWEKKSITVPSPTIGSWSIDNTVGLEVWWPLAMGATYQTATLNTWASGSLLAASTQVNGVNTGATNFKLAQVMLNTGDRAAPFALAGGDIQGEWEKARRYYRVIRSPGTDQPVPGVSCVGYLASTSLSCATRETVGMRPTTITVAIGAGITIHDAAGNVRTCSTYPTSTNELGQLGFASCTSIQSKVVHQLYVTTSATGNITFSAEL